MGRLIRPLLVILTLFLLIPGAAMAEASAEAPAKISKRVANAYYENCVSRDDPRMSDSAQNSLCSCSAAKFMEIMSLEEVVAMKKEIGPGRIAYNKMLREVYGPCMQAPIEEVLYEECSNDRHVKEFLLRDTTRLCRCTATRTGNVLAAEGAAIITRLLVQNPDMADPMNYILQDQIFRQKAYGNLYECLRSTP